jgi:hypothetical protein
VLFALDVPVARRFSELTSLSHQESGDPLDALLQCLVDFAFRHPARGDDQQAAVIRGAQM